MNEKEELKEELDQELEWVKYRQKMLDIMQGKLLQMRELAEQAKQENLTAGELESINTKINNLVAQVRALDSESRKTEYEKVL